MVVLSGLKPCVAGIILATGLYMVISNCFAIETEICVDIRAVLILVFLLLAMHIYKKVVKKKMTPIMMIVVSAMIGIMI